jgi:hypothetical protein
MHHLQFCVLPHLCLCAITITISTFCTTTVQYTWAGGDGRFWWGLASSQGRRPNMEDAHAVHLDIDGKHTALFGVFDGHAGKEVAAYCARHIVSSHVLLSSKL